MRFNYFFVTGIAYIVFIVGITFSYVGKVLECDNEPIQWSFPIFLLCILGVIFILGLLSRIDKD